MVSCALRGDNNSFTCCTGLMRVLELVVTILWRTAALDVTQIAYTALLLIAWRRAHPEAER